MSIERDAKLSVKASQTTGIKNEKKEVRVK
jgi:hypothetical protein